jgi:toxin ParE1/3/4
MRLEYSPNAFADLDGILEFVSRRSPAAAVRLLDGIEATCERLVGMPRAGTMRDELAPGLRSFTHGSYVIYFCCLTEDVLRIVRVMHSARDVKPLDFRPPSRRS